MRIDFLNRLSNFCTHSLDIGMREGLHSLHSFYVTTDLYLVLYSQKVMYEMWYLLARGQMKSILSVQLRDFYNKNFQIQHISKAKCKVFSKFFSYSYTKLYYCDIVLSFFEYNNQICSQNYGFEMNFQTKFLKIYNVLRVQ